MKFAILLLTAFSQAESGLDGATVLDRLQARRDSIENVSIHATWEEYKEGKPFAWEEQSIVSDSLGRMRMVRQSGSYNESGIRQSNPELPVRVETIYDGEKTVLKSYFSNRNRTGKLLIGEPVDDAPLGYRAAMIFEDQGPDPSGLRAYRNPMTFVSDRVIAGLSESMAEDREVAIHAAAGGGLHRIEFTRSADRGLPNTRQVALVDPSEGWVVTHIDTLDQNDGVIRSIDCRWQADENDFRIPTECRLRHFGADGGAKSPLWEWRFTTRDAKVNDPDFDESAFDIFLEPDTAVADTRYATNYRIGAEQALADDLEQLARDATAHVPVPGRPVERHRGPGFWQFVVNMVVMLLLVAALVVRRRMRAVRAAAASQ